MMLIRSKDTRSRVMGFLHSVRWSAWALPFVLAACIGDQTGALAPAPPARPALARPVDAEHQQLLEAFGGEYRAPQAEKLIQEIAARLVAATERPDQTYRVTLLNSAQVNAFALPSGRLYITRGLLALAKDSAELAAVMAHEIAHVSLRHAYQRSELELRSALVNRVVVDVLKDPQAGDFVRDQSRFSIASFSRAQELEADQVGVRTLGQAGYDPYGAVRFLNALNRQGAMREPAMSGAGDRLATHPATQERIALALQAARRLSAPGVGETGQARYLEAIDGIAYGDDPSDGLVLGRRFQHARLGIAFEAPQGFKLDNTSRAVIGTGPKGARLMFDVVAASDLPPEQALRQAWTQGIEQSDLKPLSRHGWEGAQGSAQGRGWVFRMALLRNGASSYRLVLAVPQGRETTLDLDFSTLLDTLRPLSTEETRSIRPLRLRLVTAAPGDTVETLASRMGEDLGEERFRLLNGLERGDSLKVGERYKIVTP